MLIISATVTEALGDQRKISAADSPDLKSMQPPGASPRVVWAVARAVPADRPKVKPLDGGRTSG